MSFRKTEIFLNGRKFLKIEIMQYPSIKDNNNNNDDDDDDDSNNDDKEILYYFSSSKERKEEEKIKATDKCIEIISKHNQLHCRELLKKKKSLRFYCPFHENLQTSHTKSGQLFAFDHRYICYSNKCVLPKNENGKHLVSTFKFFLEYQKI